MTDFVIDPAMELHVEYGTSEIQSYRSVTHDIIKIYGFRFKNAENGVIKATVRTEEGLRKRFSLSMSHMTHISSYDVTKHIFQKRMGTKRTMRQYYKSL